MELALYCPNLGYYERTPDSVGRSGDFYTNVSVGRVFGELLARQFGLSVVSIGTVGGGRLVVELTGSGATGAAEERGSGVADAIDVPLANLRHAWDHGLARALGWESPAFASEGR